MRRVLRGADIGSHYWVGGKVKRRGGKQSRRRLTLAQLEFGTGPDPVGNHSVGVRPMNKVFL